MISEWGSFIFIGALAVAICGALGGSPGLRVIRHLLVVGAVMRIVGVLARYTMIFDIYGGSDAVGYFNSGNIIADHVRAFDFSIIGSGQWSDREWGTQAVRYASGFVLTFVGPSMRGSFLVFSLAAFAGLVCTAVATDSASPTISTFAPSSPRTPARKSSWSSTRTTRTVTPRSSEASVRPRCPRRESR
jgi:hypothetical protein